MSGVIIEDRAFKLAEVGVSGIPEKLIDPVKIDAFEEFHACELFGGYGIFEGIDQTVRFDAIERLLAIIRALDVRIVYGAVDLEKLKEELFASADPLDICFRMCLQGIDKWADSRLDERLREEIGTDRPEVNRFHEIVFRNIMEELVIVILDECDGKAKATLTRTFRTIRPPSRAGKFTANCLHDDMYFGDSRFSVGIQLADLCSYFIAKHLDGDIESEGFFRMIEPNIVHGQQHPPRLANLEALAALASTRAEEQSTAQTLTDESQAPNSGEASAHT